MISQARSLTLAVASAAAIALAGWSASQAQDSSRGGFLGFGGGGDEEIGIGVNSFLWRASLDTIDFMPLASADPFGGVLITDWYTPPGQDNERFKATIYILDTRLRADGINVNIFRQIFDPERGWVDAAVEPSTEITIENTILTRARQLRIATLEN